jgi:CxxC motif-containing protein (DUF1111 family)
MDPNVMVSPRISRQLVGLGLLQAVSEETIRGFAANVSSGHPNYVWDVKNQKMTMGRFGWKASEPSVEQQTLLAFVQDIGITSSMFPDKNCPPAQTDCANAPVSQSKPNLSELKANAIVVHGVALGVPARRHMEDPEALRGEELFTNAGCVRCHIPEMVTGTLEGWPELSNQTIHPYSDLLLHYMGEGLADNRPEYEASGAEWRTPPLWGVGLIETVNGHTFLLNDGRARSFAEAILWHGGEAETPRENFRKMPAADRAALIAFLKSL